MLQGKDESSITAVKLRDIIKRAFLDALGQAEADPHPTPPSPSPLSLQDADDGSSTTRSSLSALSAKGADALDESQLAEVVTELFTKLGRPMPWGDDLGKLDKLVKDTIRKFDDNNDGKIDFLEFANVLSHEPFLGLLPPQTHAAIPHLLREEIQVAPPKAPPPPCP